MTLSILRTVLIAGVIGYVAVAALAYAFQDRLLYPSAGAAPRPSLDRLRAAGMALWPASAPRALVAEVESARATVVVFHGNGGTALDRSYYVDALRRRGLRVVLAEYPAYGWRDGATSETAFVADARETIQMTHDAFGGPLVVWGESLGAGVAAAALRDLSVPVAGAVLLTPWDRLPAVAQQTYPFLPVRWLLRDRYDSSANLAGFRGRVAVVVAEADRVIPASHGIALHDALDAEKRLWTFPDAGHNTWPAAPSAAWWDEVLAFVLGAS